MVRACLALAAVLAALCVLSACAVDVATTPSPSAPATAMQVDRVVDGDTIRVFIDGEVQRVRLLGVDTPEVQPELECFADEARAFVESILPPGSSVTLERDVSDTDRFGRLLRYVYLEDGRVLNELLLQEGYAHVVSFPPDTSHVNAYRELEETARSEGRGRWSACPADR